MGRKERKRFEIISLKLSSVKLVIVLQILAYLLAT